MIYIICERCKFEARFLSERCPKCGELYVCDWDQSIYSEPWKRASMGRSPFARRVANWFVRLAAVFTVYGFVVHAMWPNKDAWGNYFAFTAFLAFSSYEVWAFTRGRKTTIDTMTHEAIPENTAKRVFGLVLDVALALFSVYAIVTYDA